MDAMLREGMADDLELDGQILYNMDDRTQVSAVAARGPTVEPPALLSFWLGTVGLFFA